MVLNNLYRAALISFTTLLIACTSSPISIKLQPELSANQPSPLINKTTWKINSQDLRIAQYLIEISKEKGAATLVNGSQSSRLIIEKLLQQQWTKQGLIINTQSAHKINIQVIKLLAKVKQNLFSHQINSQVVINVQLKNGGKVFNKVYKSNANQEGPLNVSIEKTSKLLNTQLSQLLDEIVQDSELNAKLQQL